MTALQDQIDALNLWDLDTQVEQALDARAPAGRAPPGAADVTALAANLGGEKRRVGADASAAVEAAFCSSTSLPTPRRRKRRLAGTLPQRLRRAAFILVTHERLLPHNLRIGRWNWTAARACRGKANYFELARTESQARSQREGGRGSRQKAISPRIGVDPLLAKARQPNRRRVSPTSTSSSNRPGREEAGKASFSIAEGPRLGDWSSKSKASAKPSGDRLLIDNCRSSCPRRHRRRHRPNGAGKTTLFKMLTARRRPDQGTIKLGPTVKLSYVDQSRDHLDDAKTVWEEISLRPRHHEVRRQKGNPSRAYCGWVQLQGPDQQKKVGLLSGCERNRVHLAKMLKEGGTCCSSTSRPTTSTRKPWAHWNPRSRISPAAPWHLA